mmetsp:Transcript_7300/g.15720  ORF Transcript_7300/g.15720 Transcript_7300/m.15720 type:complete len:101 (-) Transcript_7300:552-854(-)
MQTHSFVRRPPPSPDLKPEVATLRETRWTIRSGEKLSQCEVSCRRHLNDKLAAHMMSRRNVKSRKDVCQLEGLDLWHSQVPGVHQISQLIKKLKVLKICC